MGAIYQSQEEFERANECHKKCLAIQLAFQGDVSDRQIIDTCFNLVLSNFSSRNRQRARNCS
mgnify:CR=1 FL=1